MAQEPKEWSKASRRTTNGSKGGMHVYVDSDALNYALNVAGIPLDAELKVRRYPLKGDKGVAKILIKIREDKPLS